MQSQTTLFPSPSDLRLWLRLVRQLLGSHPPREKTLPRAWLFRTASGKTTIQYEFTFISSFREICLFIECGPFFASRLTCSDIQYLTAPVSLETVISQSV